MTRPPAILHSPPPGRQPPAPRLPLATPKLPRSEGGSPVPRLPAPRPPRRSSPRAKADSLLLRLTSRLRSPVSRLLFFSSFSLLLSPFSSPSASAAELTDLGQGLSYLRVHEYSSVAKAVASVVPTDRPFILDLRHAEAGPEDATAFASALSARRGPTPLFILVGPNTPPALAAVLTPRPAGTLVVGIAGAQPAPDVVVQQSSEADRRAWDALESGLPLAALVNGRIEKERFDESHLTREFANGPRDPRGPAATPPAEPAAPVLTDRVLQRAIHLHRALLAIRPRS